MHDLEVVRQAYLEVSFRLAVIDLGLSHLVVVPVVHENLFRVLVKDVDCLGHRRVQVRNVRCLWYVCHDFLLDARLRHLVVFADVGALSNVCENLLVLLDGLATRTREE